MLTALFVTLLIYLCFGAACFSALETEYEDERWAAGEQDVSFSYYYSLVTFLSIASSLIFLKFV